MKRNTIILSTAIGLAAAYGLANAGQSLAPVNVNATAQANCTPPNSQAVCAAWHEQIRRNFNQREIGMLFGARTSYPNYGASFDRVKARYGALQGEFTAAQTSELGTVASK
ncbi:MAG: hypothetical protein ACREPN_07750 [Rudaea sp.]